MIHFPFLLLFFVYHCESAIVNIPWDLDTNNTYSVSVGDTLSFVWTGSDTHNVAWQWDVFPTSSDENTLGHNETFTIDVSHAGQTLHAFCGIHPSMQATINVAPTLSYSPTQYTSGLTVDIPWGVGLNAASTYSVSIGDTVF